MAIKTVRLRDGTVYQLVSDFCRENNVCQSHVGARLHKRWPESLKRIAGEGSKRKLLYATQECLETNILPRLQRKISKGVVYGFIPVGDSRILKIGRTADWGKRKYAFIGLNRPSQMVFMVETRDQVSAEQALLRHAGNVLERSPFGDEWFVIPDNMSVDTLRDMFDPVLRLSAKA